MPKELVIIYDTPNELYPSLIERQNLPYYLKFFDKLRILYWSKEKASNVFEKEDGKFIFYPYPKPYSSGYLTGLKYMVWIGKTLWQICQKSPKDTKLVFLSIMPIWPGIPTLLVGKLKRKKIVLRLEAARIDYLTLEESLENRPKILTFFKTNILRLIYYLTLSFFDFVIVISDGILKEAKHYGAQKIIKIPIPININPFLAKSEKQAQKATNPIILYVGQIKKAKGIDNLVRALGLLNKEGNWSPKLLIAGGVSNPKDEAFFEELKQLAKGLDVEFLGWVPHQDLPSIYQRATVFVLPSYSEALGMAIMEAMASGLPVVASDISGPRELVKDGKTGFLVKPGEPEIIKEKLSILLENPDLKESMGIAGRERIQEIMKEVDENNKKLWNKLLTK